ncbi:MULTISPECIES: alpha/beta fold hydrolase [unclassified Roseovarius]|uniref:alpha/beta fold hydrolase n=1 Tax=unclassified Roseovarius TaxID=2614913 RepID=UPI00273FDA7E|nr:MULTISPECIES: alpha/beta hydrolase [unclassified Roseovarius]
MIRLKRLVIALLIVVLLPSLGFRGAAMLRETQTAAEAQPETGRMVDTGLGAIYVQEVGPVGGTPLLLAHGTAAWSGLWAETMTALAEQGYRVIAFDMPPFGFSDRDPAGDYSRQTQARRILSLVEALGTRPVLIAHSFGAAPATEAVMMRQEAFAGLVIVDGALGLNSHEAEASLPLPLRPAWLRRTIVSLTGTNPLLTKTLLSQLLYVKEAATDEVVEILQRPMVIESSTAAFANWLPSLLVPPKTALSTRPDNFRALDLPTRLIWGDKDTVTPPEQADELAALIGQGPPHLLTDVGHIPQIEAPEAFQALLISVLSDMKAGN